VGEHVDEQLDGEDGGEARVEHVQQVLRRPSSRPGGQAVRQRSSSSQAAVKQRSSSGQTAVKQAIKQRSSRRSSSGAVSVKSWRIQAGNGSLQAAVKQRSSSGQAAVKQRSNRRSKSSQEGGQTAFKQRSSSGQAAVEHLDEGRRAVRVVHPLIRQLRLEHRRHEVLRRRRKISARRACRKTPCAGRLPLRRSPNLCFGIVRRGHGGACVGSHCVARRIATGWRDGARSHAQPTSGSTSLAALGQRPESVCDGERNSLNRESSRGGAGEQVLHCLYRMGQGSNRDDEKCGHSLEEAGVVHDSDTALHSFPFSGRFGPCNCNLGENRELLY
jgi:hypothetical protein